MVNLGDEHFHLAHFVCVVARTETGSRSRSTSLKAGQPVYARAVA